MAKYTKPDYSEQWASAGNIVAPNSAKIQAGHIVEKPNYEYMNWLQNRQDTAIAYSLQMGIVEWDNATQYQYTLNSHASYVQRNGVVYKAIQTGTNKDPLTEAAYWTIAFDDKGSAATVQSNLTTHITNYGTLTGLTNTTTARTNLDVYSKAEAAQKNGDSTKLFSVADGTTGNEAVNKSQLDTKAPIAGNSLQEFAVATATTGNSAVNKAQFDAKTGLATDSIVGISREATAAEVLAGALSGVFISPNNLSSAFPANDTAFQLSISLPNGYILKMGRTEYGELPAGVVTVPSTFANAFPSACLFALASPYNPNLSGQMAFICTMRTWSSTGISVDMVELSGSGDQFNASYVWFAIGK